MTTDPYNPIVMPQREPRARHGGRLVLLAGVAGACALGAGAGLWARPAMNERRMAAPEATVPAPATPRRLQIVVDERPAPIGPPIEVLAKGPAAHPSIAPEPAYWPPAEPRAPRPAPDGLLRVVGPAVAQAFERLAHPRFAAPPTVRATLETAARPMVARIAPPAPEAAATRLAAAHADAVRRAVQAARAERQAELARAEAARTAAHRIEVAKAARAEKLRLAQAEARGHARALAEARQAEVARAEQARKQQIRLASLVRSMARALPQRTRPEPPAILTARLDRRHGKATAAHSPRLERTAVKSAKAHAAAKLTPVARPVRPRPEPAPPQPRAAGLMRVSAHCASRDPGEALVCADPGLNAADRQLTRAYQEARAAGVPDAQLRQQQQRWLAARSAAAREAPWAVHDVYLARIAELNGQAREAHDDGY